MTQFKKPLNERTNPKDEAVRQASRVGERHQHYTGWNTYEAQRQRDLSGELVTIPLGTSFKPNKPGTKVDMPNEGPATKWPGNYPSVGE